MKTQGVKNGPSGGSGFHPEDPQETSPLTFFLGSAQTRPRRRQNQGALAPWFLKRMIREPFVKRLSRHILGLRPRYSTFS